MDCLQINISQWFFFCFKRQTWQAILTINVASLEETALCTLNRNWMYLKRHTLFIELGRIFIQNKDCLKQELLKVTQWVFFTFWGPTIYIERGRKIDFPFHYNYCLFCSVRLKRIMILKHCIDMKRTWKTVWIKIARLSHFVFLMIWVLFVSKITYL